MKSLVEIQRFHLENNARIHSELVDMLNHITNLIETAELSDLPQCLDKLNKKFTWHFNAENTMMEMMNYPHRFEHEMFHSKIKQQLAVLIAAPVVSLCQLKHHLESLTEKLTVHLHEYDEALDKYAAQFLESLEK